MSRDPSGIYSYPDGTRGSPGTTIFSARYNTFLDDLAVTLNTKLPINMGGTNANSADAALKNLSAEKATQLVTDYNTHVWFPGSFRSDAAAPGAPNATSSFAGIAYINEPLENPPTNQNVVVEARDMSSAVKPGLLYTRQKTAGVWSAWNFIGGSEDQTAARSAIYAAPFDAMAYNGMQVNGGMEVSQEYGTGGVVVPTMAAGAQFEKYVIDNWIVSGQGGGVGNSLSCFIGPTSLIGFAKSLTILTTGGFVSSTDDYFVIRQLIEGYRISRLAFGTASAQPVTLSFWFLSDYAGQMGITLRNADVTRNMTKNVTLAVGWNFKTVTFPGDTGGSWNQDNGRGFFLDFSLAAGTSKLAPPDVWTSTVGFGSTGQTNFLEHTGRSCQLTGVVVLPGTQAPTEAKLPLIMRPYDQELVTCQRYYYKSGVADGLTLYPRSPSDTSRVGGRLHPLAMRATPTMGVTGILNYAGGQLPADSISAGSLAWECLYNVGNTTGVILVQNVTADARL